MASPRHDPIEHVVLLMLENRSFFRIFGYMDPNRDKYVNISDEGKAYYSTPTDDRETPDPPHEIDFVTFSMEGGKPDNYVKSYQKYHKHIATKGMTEDDLKDIMGYTRKGFLPTLHKMEEFGSLCTQWYCSVSGPTWPNRMFAVGGTSHNWRTTPETNLESAPQFQKFLKEWYAFVPPAPQKKSIFDIFKEKNVSYNVYSDNVGQFTLSNIFYPTLVDADDIDDFKEHAKKGKLPRFSFIEPNYIPCKLLRWVQNDDHPPADPIEAQTFIAEIYEALRTSPKWNNTLLVVTYDEHGGFFDPIIPPPAPAPDAVSTDAEGTFAKFGVRVPTLLVSPCIKQGLDNTVYDHTSVLKYMLEKWAPDSVGHLGERTKAANSLPILSAPRKDPFPSIGHEEISKGKFLRLNVKFPGSIPASIKQAKVPLDEAANIAFSAPDVLAQLKALLVENQLVKDHNPAELASIAVASLALGGVKRVGAVTVGTALAAADAVVDAEKHAEKMLGKAHKGISGLLGHITGGFHDIGSSVAQDAVDVIATQLKAVTLLAEREIGPGNDLARFALWALKFRAEELARNMIRKGKKI